MLFIDTLAVLLTCTHLRLQSGLRHYILLGLAPLLTVDVERLWLLVFKFESVPVYHHGQLELSVRVIRLQHGSTSRVVLSPGLVRALVDQVSKPLLAMQVLGVSILLLGGRFEGGSHLAIGLNSLDKLIVIAELVLRG